MFDVCVILDRSGSMQARKSDHEGGLRSFIEDQQKLADAMRFTLVQFDSEGPCDVKLDRVPLHDVDPAQIALIPRGETPLYDAIGKAVAHLRKTLTPQDNTVVMIITDGEENSSREWTKPKVKALLDELEAANWKFLFLGASLEAFAEGESLGVQRGAAAMFAQASGQSVRAGYRSLSINTVGTRSEVGIRGQMTNSVKARMNFTPDQIAAMLVDDDVDPLQVTTSTTAADGAVFYSGSNQMPSLPVVPDDSEEQK
jgi:uncharacterized protein YegL